MRTKHARKRTMMTSSDTLESVRPFANALVERAERQTGSRMAAYEMVASTVGVTSTWLRKFLGRQPGLVVEYHEGLNIIAAYRALCERIEAEAEHERKMLAALRGKADAALDCTHTAVVVSPRQDEGREATRPPLSGGGE
jgi:tellurite resistance protein